MFSFVYRTPFLSPLDMQLLCMKFVIPAPITEPVAYRCSTGRDGTIPNPHVLLIIY